MQFLKDVLGDMFVDVSERIESYNREHPEKKVKLADLSGGNYVSKAKFNDLEAEASRLKAQLASLKAQESDSNEDEDSLKKELSDLKALYEKDTDALKKELNQARFDGALDLALEKCGARNIKAVRALLDLDSLELEDGQLAGLSAQLDAVRAENGFLFSGGALSTAMKQGGSAPAADGFVVSARRAAGLTQP